MYSLLWEHIIEHAPLSDSQWGFQKRKSAVLSLLLATHEWHSLMDRQKDVFFDFQKAFDTVPHHRLMERLANIGIHPLLLSWLCSYLSRRKQHVIVNGECSHSTYVLSGVPQGSVLGPLLFLIYIDTITSLPFSEATKVSIYADDLLVYKPIETYSCFQELQEDINLIQRWSVENLMSFNTAKCKCMLLTQRRNQFCPTMMLNGQSLENVKQYKYLGVLISSNLCWSPHVKEICNSARKMLSLLYRNFATNVTDPSVILQLYLALVRPRLEYAAEVWNPNLERDINCIERVQKFALRICSHHYQDSYDDLLHFLYQPTLRNRRFLSLCTFFKIVKELVYFPSVIRHFLYQLPVYVILILLESLLLVAMV